MQVFKAAKLNNLEQVKFLIEKKGAPVNVTNKREKTIAHIAVRNDNLDMLDYVLVRDPSLLTKTDNHNSTILQLAVERGALDVVKYLVENVVPIYLIGMWAIIISLGPLFIEQSSMAT